jgi:hypothetical protein
MNSKSENNEWIDLTEDIRNIDIENNVEETVTPTEEQSINKKTEEMIDDIVENIIDNALETAQNDLYTEVNNRSKTQENQNQADNNDFYYDIFKLVSVIAGCRLFFSVIEWAN